MNLLFIISAAFAVASAGVVDESSAPVVKSIFNLNPDGYKYSYETGNGIYSKAEGVLDPVKGAITVKGAFKYISPEGLPIEITYNADENGFQPQGNFLPVGPPTPEAIVRAIEWIRSHPPPVKSDPKRFS